MIELRGVDIGYDGHAVISGMDLTITAGEAVGILGPNGSGKSTLIRGLLGLAPVLAGSLQLFGSDDTHQRDRLRIGYVPQRQTVLGGVPATVSEVVGSGRLGRRRNGRRRAGDRAAVADALEAVGLADRASQSLGDLSGGQQRRVLIARALASRPEILILDEPTAGVDIHNQELLARTLNDLKVAGTTILLVTHELGPVRPVFTRALALREGDIVYDGPPDSIPDEHDGHHDDDWHHEHGEPPERGTPGVGLVG
ncbi:MAG: metal ABC transporter ATP-binding protein [Aquihabitans sp.]